MSDSLRELKKLISGTPGTIRKGEGCIIAENIHIPQYPYVSHVLTDADLAYNSDPLGTSYPNVSRVLTDNDLSVLGMPAGYEDQGLTNPDIMMILSGDVPASDNGIFNLDKKIII